MKLSHHNVAAIGDAENDLPMLMQSECGVAVDNALESVKRKADIVTKGDHGAGVEELIADLLKDDLGAGLQRWDGRSAVGDDERGSESQGANAWSGAVGAGGWAVGQQKVTAITGILERIAAAGY